MWFAMAMGAKTTVLGSPVLALRPWACQLGYIVAVGSVVVADVSGFCISFGVVFE